MSATSVDPQVSGAGPGVPRPGPALLGSALWGSDRSRFLRPRARRDVCGVLVGRAGLDEPSVPYGCLLRDPQPSPSAVCRYERFPEINFFVSLFVCLFVGLFVSFPAPDRVLWLSRDRKDRIIKVRITLRSCC